LQDGLPLFFRTALQSRIGAPHRVKGNDIPDAANPCRDFARRRRARRAAHAADNGIYVGGSVGRSGVHFDPRVDGTSIHYDADGTGYKRIAGWLAVESDYVDLGSGSDQVAGEKIHTNLNGVTLSALGFFAVAPVDVFARRRNEPECRCENPVARRKGQR